MKKDDLKSLVTQMYNNLLDTIDEQETASKEQVIEYLKDSVKVVSNIDDDEIDSTEHAKSAFDNAYKIIADKSISSYKNTNEKFAELTQMHEKTISSCSGSEIDVPSIMEKFNDIQNHMMSEVSKANSVINKLSSQVKVLEKDSNLDSLTKVFNRRALTTHLNSICENTNRNYELHLLILDIDDFKKINDIHGHIAGDKILIFIANILKKTVRDGDKVFRYGGEEFIILLNRISQKDCQTITLRLLELVRKSKLIYKGESINITMSIGSTVLLETDKPDTVIARADKALYRAKNSGKDQMQMEINNGI